MIATITAHDHLVDYANHLAAWKGQELTGKMAGPKILTDLWLKAGEELKGVSR